MKILETQDGYKVRPLTWPDARSIMRPLFDGREHWTMVIHGSALRLLIEIEERYYTGERNPDLTVIATFHRGQPFALVAARKRHMPAYKLASMLRQFTDVRLSERELLKRDLLIVAPDPLMDAATELAASLLSSDDLAMSE